MKSSTSNKDGGNRSLMRGLAVLDCVGRHGETGVRIADLVRECDLERPTIYRLLATLIDCGYVEQIERFRYALCSTHVKAVNSPLDTVVEQLSSVLKRVSEVSEDAAFAIIREGTQSHCIARQIGSFPVQAVTVEVGRRQPLGVGAAGMALLASLPETDASEIIKANASALASYGGMTPARLQLLLKTTRERGWSVVGNHVIENILGVGISVPALHFGVPAAISVAAPVQRMSQARQQFLIKTMKKALEECTSRIT
ncbi:IclR family transcriptional regulator [Hydrogenophaga sp.]|uniref:IclR family transcriptional regulator n=1 Tax=Hydrogenophaga sp. TaxID=1904254 RepID=UPI0035B3A0DC